LKQYCLIDFYVIKEGEVALEGLLSALITNTCNLSYVKTLNLPSVHTVENTIENDALPVASRIKNLEEIPSPYLDGRLDEFFDGKLMPLLQTNRGCPFTCTFCVEGLDYYNKINRNDLSKVEKEIDYIGMRMKLQKEQGGRNDLFIADSNFGMYSHDLEVARALSAAQKNHGWPEYINVATGKNQKERVLKVAKLVNGALRLSGSVQSLDQAVLDNIKRKNISSDGLVELALSAKSIGANSYCEIILALPGETNNSHKTTVKKVIDAGFNNVFLFQLMLLPGSELATIESRNTYEMTTRFRVLPRCYGNYLLLDKTVLAAEIEEICVSTNTLSYEEYLDCRYLHLIVSLFYNDGIFENLLKLVRGVGLSPWRWIEILMATEMGPKLDGLIRTFRESTKTELWSSPEELKDFICSENTVERYLDGEIGNNLLFVHKVQAILDCPDELARLAGSATEKLFFESGLLDDQTREFIQDCVKYRLCQMTNLFANTDEILVDSFGFNLIEFERSEDLVALGKYKLDNKKDIEFSLNDKQQDIIKRYLSLYGSDRIGIGRIVSKVYVKKLFRCARFSGYRGQRKFVEHAEIAEISGLQN